MRLELGDCLEVLKTIPDNSVDSIVTDPPYGLSFMNKKWDYDVPSVEIWKECLRVLKPGGHLLSFGGSRTYHRMAVRIEDAGFEIRDQIMWVYGSGFPKSHNIGKSVDKLQGNERDEYIKTDGIGTDSNSGKYNMNNGNSNLKKEYIDSKGTSEWEGWGTALKPAHEPIVMARKPLSEKTVALNVLRWGTGGINIDESRVGETVETWPSSRSYKSGNVRNRDEDNSDAITQETSEAPNGRWPANIIFDEEAGQVLDQQSGISKSNTKSSIVEDKEANIFNDGKTKTTGHKKKIYVGDYNDKGGASRFFYCPKASKKDRDEGMDGFEETISEIAQINSQTKLQPNGEYVENKVLPRKNNHPTVKPTDLMLYLIKLVTPVKGVVMDPFMGSGSTGKGAIRGGFDFIGIEREEEYIKIAEARIKNELNG
jgi:site-specific DNA-methyltransferase (adenine-specific)